MDKQKLEILKNHVFEKYPHVEEGVCRVCGCTYYEPCIDEDCNTCSWVTTDETLCSFCFEGVYKEMFQEEVVYDK
ncbi:hypothetical protein [Anaerorhabdus sp.]|uniref:hypothetical protein n=1 Tax=Anaerorhabdus sp. TaxID=1872524 RepID=UPI002FC91982